MKMMVKTVKEVTGFCDTLRGSKKVLYMHSDFAHMLQRNYLKQHTI